jgi:hypothetical protein
MSMAFIIDNLFAALGGIIALALFIGLSYLIAPNFTKRLFKTIIGDYRKKK